MKHKNKMTHSKIFSRFASNKKRQAREKGFRSGNLYPLSKIKPTQKTVGLQQVSQKQKKLRKFSRCPKKLKRFLHARPIPVVIGPEQKVYAIDHHHHGRALIHENHKFAPVKVVADYSSLSQDEFWAKMDEMQYIHNRNANGQKVPFKEMPSNLIKLSDDPYRSLAGFARKRGAFTKVDIPFSEFKWADYFRARISKELITKDFNKAVKLAVSLARHQDAESLPGYIPEVNEKLGSKKDGDNPSPSLGV